MVLTQDIFMKMEIKQTGEGVIFPVKVVPGSSRTRIAGQLGTALKVNIAAAPEKGKANKQLIKFLAGFLDRPRSDITITAGQHNSRKQIQIAEMTKKQLLELLAPEFHGLG